MNLIEAVRLVRKIRTCCRHAPEAQAQSDGAG